jgi:hypothetical protein
VRSKGALTGKKKKWETYKKYPSACNWNAYAEARSTAAQATTAARRNYEHSIANHCKTNPKALYSYINKKKTGAPTCITNADGSSSSQPSCIVTAFNDHFASVFQPADPTPLVHPTPQVSDIKEIVFHQRQIRDLLSALPCHKSPGPDNIHASFLKHCADALSYPLTIIFKQSHQQCAVPNDWKLAHITPIHKSGSRKITNNYRPISLTPHISKIFEKIMKEHILDHFESNGTLSNRQHGFRRGFSCLTSLLEATNHWTSCLDGGHPCDVLLLDIRKAFDSVCHTTLLRKLGSMGITGSTLSWIEQFITHRFQRVAINGVLSDWTPVTSGVPQGTVLGPVLFLAYINDIPNAITNLCNLFADDLLLYRCITSNSDHHSLQHDVDSLTAWAKANKLAFNVNKSAVLHLGRTNQNLDYHIQDDPIPSTTQAKSLGVIFTEDLKVAAQCKAATTRANQILGRIKRNFRWLTPRVLRILYTTYVRPHLDYCVQAWSPYFAKDVALLESVQRRASRLLPHLKPLPYVDRLKCLGLTTLANRRTRGDLLETFKIMNNIDHRKPADYFIDPLCHSTRGHARKLQLPFARTLIRKNSFPVRVVKPWNALPHHLTVGSNPNKWKEAYDKWTKST